MIPEIEPIKLGGPRVSSLFDWLPTSSGRGYGNNWLVGRGTDACLLMTYARVAFGPRLPGWMNQQKILLGLKLA